MKKLIKYVVFDIVQNKIIIAYTAFLLLMAFSFLGLSDDITKGILSIMNLTLIIVPLVSIIFATIHFYNSYEFIEMMLAQPMSRKKIFMSEYLGVASSLSYALIIGLGVPLLFYSPTVPSVMLLIISILLTWVFVSLAFLASVLTRDKAKGIGISLLLWFYFSLIYDAIVVGILFSFNDYPLEKPMLALTSLNPVDVGRIMLLLQLDVAALMGYTGAIFQEILTNKVGIIIAFLIIMLWIIIPVYFALRSFTRKDL